MPNKNSAKKYIRVTARKTAQNRKVKKNFRDAVKELEVLIKEGKKEEAKKNFTKAQKSLDKAAKRGVIKKNTAARKKSRLSAKIK